MKKKVSHVPITVYVVLTGAVLIFGTYLFTQFSSYDQLFLSKSPFLFQIMNYFLIFIFLRVAAHLILSFLDYLFTKRLEPAPWNPLVTIMVPCHNEERVVEKAVHSALRINYPNKEILIIDDGSTDKTLDIAIELSLKYPQVRAITQQNGGKSRALNFGLSQANGDYVLCMDADSVISSNALTMAMKYFNYYPDLAAIAGGVKVGNDNNFLTAFQKLEYIVGLNFFKSAQSCLSVVPVVPGPIGIFKKEILLKLGGYEHDTFAEDTDLSMRILMHGHDIKYCAGIWATTEAPDSMMQLLTQRYRWSRGITQAILKNVAHFNAVQKKGRAAAILFYMFCETIILPALTFIFAIVTLQYFLYFNNTTLLGPYFLGLTLLDLFLSLYAVVMEKELFFLFVLSVFNRITYGFMLDIVRFFATIDEMFKVPMKWGTMIRKGLKDVN